MSIKIKREYIQRATKGANSYEHLLSELINAEHYDKWLYNINEVITIVGKDYRTIYFEKSYIWEKKRIESYTLKNKERTETLIKQILKGETTKNDILNCDDLYITYIQNYRSIDRVLNKYQPLCDINIIPKNKIMYDDLY